MINKIGEEWDGIGEAVGSDRMSKLGKSSDILQAIQGVRDALRQMCQVSVTRTTLKSAVREALLALVREQGDELFPELRQEVAALRTRLEGLASSGARPLASLSLEAEPDLEARLPREAGAGTERSSEDPGTGLAGLRQWVGEVNFRAAGLESELGRAHAAMESLEGSLGADREAFAEGLRGGFLAVEEKLATLRAQVLDLIRRVEDSVPETAQAKAAEVELKLRREIEDMVHSLIGKLAELRDMLSRVEGTLPRREMLEAVEARLVRLEERFVRVAGQVESIDSLTPDVRALGDKLLELRAQIGQIASELLKASSGVGDLQEGLTARLVELRSILDSGIGRWESDQSQMLERLSAIRDSLRDELHEVTSRAEPGQASLFGKITGRRAGSLKLSKDEMDRLSARIEGVIAGLESILAKRRG